MLLKTRRRKFWGWGYEGDGLTAADVADLRKSLGSRFGLSHAKLEEAPRIEDIQLREPRISPPRSFGEILSTDRWDRAEHTLGQAYQDLIRGMRGQYQHPPDLVAFPRNEADIVALCEWCSDERVAVIPYGGGSSVAGGVEPDVGDGFTGTVSIDLRHLDKVLELDRNSRAARIQAGVLGPDLENQLRPHGLSLRHFPQSFEMSSLGGWIATRAAGHHAVLNTYIDDYVESLRVVTPRGIVETRRVPASGAGPAPDRLFMGSEGILGIITESWVRLLDRPRFRASATIEFDSFARAADAVREIAQSGLYPANCRLLDPDQVLLSNSGDGTMSLLIVTFESAHHEMQPELIQALEICRASGGRTQGDSLEKEVAEGTRQDGASGRWREWFIRAGHTRDAMIRMGIMNSTFESSIPWSHFPEFNARVLEVTRAAVKEVCGVGLVCCRLAYAYPDGPAPYYTVVAPARRGSELQQWAAIKDAASEATLSLGGTITHHHAVGRYHRPWYDRERPPLFADALRAAKEVLDPAGVMNPGVLIDPQPQQGHSG